MEGIPQEWEENIVGPVFKKEVQLHILNRYWNLLMYVWGWNVHFRSETHIETDFRKDP
jgi:hypothetical protein